MNRNKFRAQKSPRVIKKFHIHTQCINDKNLHHIIQLHSKVKIQSQITISL